MAAGTRKVNWFAIWISVAVVVALVAVGGLVVLDELGLGSAGTGETPKASNINTDTGAIKVGDGLGRARHLHRLHVPDLQPVRARSYGDDDPGPHRRRLDHPQHPPHLDPRPLVAGHGVLDPGCERDVLRRGVGCRMPSCRS